MLKIKEERPYRMGSYFDYELENGTLLHSDEWNGERYFVKENGREAEYIPVYRWQAEGTEPVEERLDNVEEFERSIEIVGFEKF